MLRHKLEVKCKSAENGETDTFNQWMTLLSQFYIICESLTVSYCSSGGVGENTNIPDSSYYIPCYSRKYSWEEYLAIWDIGSLNSYNCIHS